MYDVALAIFDVRAAIKRTRLRPVAELSVRLFGRTPAAEKNYRQDCRQRDPDMCNLHGHFFLCRPLPVEPLRVQDRCSTRRLYHLSIPNSRLPLNGRREEECISLGNEALLIERKEIRESDVDLRSRFQFSFEAPHYCCGAILFYHACDLVASVFDYPYAVVKRPEHGLSIQRFVARSAVDCLVVEESEHVLDTVCID